MADNELREAVKDVYVELLRDRDRWSRSTEPGAAERAVAYQSAAGRIMRVLDDHPPTVARYLEPPHDQLAAPAIVKAEPCLWGQAGAPACQPGIRDDRYWCEPCCDRRSQVAS